MPNHNEPDLDAHGNKIESGSNTTVMAPKDISVIYHNTRTKLGFKDRIKVLFGAQIYIENRIAYDKANDNVEDSNATTTIK